MEKIKQLVESEKGKDILVIIIIILVSLGSFELGRLSKNSATPGIKIEYQDQQGASAIESFQDNFTNIQKSNSGNYFASNRGSKYYSLSCSGGKTIKQENRIYFTTSMDAEEAGYDLSSSCE